MCREICGLCSGLCDEKQEICGPQNSAAHVLGSARRNLRTCAFGICDQNSTISWAGVFARFAFWYITHTTQPVNEWKRAPLSDEKTGDQPRPNGGKPLVVEELKVPSLASPHDVGQVRRVGLGTNMNELGVDVNETIFACKFAERGTGV